MQVLWITVVSVCLHDLVIVVIVFTLHKWMMDGLLETDFIL